MSQTAITPGDETEFVTVAEAVQLSKSSEPTIRRKLTTGELTRYKFGARTLIRKSQLLSLIRPA